MIAAILAGILLAPIIGVGIASIQVELELHPLWGYILEVIAGCCLLYLMFGRME